jgi:hypothetical protein
MAMQHQHTQDRSAQETGAGTQEGDTTGTSRSTGRQTAQYAGGCRCGGVRYTISEPPVGSRICHCRSCQLAMASPFLAQAQFPRRAFTITGATERFRSSDRLFRHFCPACGTRLFLEPVDDTGRLGIPLATLDEPGAISPDQHIWIEHKLPWIVLGDNLPKHPRASPDKYRTF